jgi:hypothetical protein
MENETNKSRTPRPEQIMNYQTEKFVPPTQLTAPMFSSPWLALYLHLKANLNQGSSS